MLNLATDNIWRFSALVSRNSFAISKQKVLQSLLWVSWQISQKTNTAFLRNIKNRFSWFIIAFLVEMNQASVGLIKTLISTVNNFLPHPHGNGVTQVVGLFTHNCGERMTFLLAEPQAVFQFTVRTRPIVGTAGWIWHWMCFRTHARNV